ncbi:hypothetical protein HNW13_018190 [Shewanella sp. BF02_Schw]|uniref:hypothetical protein n=1 Tax=Shewanella sp. BF02_Schw TaxID=394908 RepID=UPI00177C874F|nr:hypothetical protein [Shewanella sp. BF02_Schw]MBO1897671.1 hypothetical protein [Shewanella sp. BF02_Schw]
MSQSVSDGVFVGHLPKQLLISDMFTEFSFEDHLNCPFAQAYEQVKGVPFFKGAPTPMTLVYNENCGFQLPKDTLDFVSGLTGYHVTSNADSLDELSILHIKVDATDYSSVCAALENLTKSKRTVLEIINFKNIDHPAFVALDTLIDLKTVNGKP